jgi:hypothetical protein
MFTNKSGVLRDVTIEELHVTDGGATPLEGIAWDTVRAAVSSAIFGGLSGLSGGGIVDGLIHEPTHQ